MSKKRPVQKDVNSLTTHEELKKKMAAMEKLMSAIRKDIGRPSDTPADGNKNQGGKGIDPGTP